MLFRPRVLIFLLTLSVSFLSTLSLAQSSVLVETSVSLVGSGPYAAGGTIQVMDTVSNTGSGVSVSSSTYFYLSTSATTTGTYLGSRNIAGLAGGGSSTGTTTLTLPAGISGTYYVVASNNAASSILVSSAAITVGGPSLSETSVSLVGSGPYGAGSTLQVTDTVSNTGAGASLSSVTWFYLATSATATGGTSLSDRGIGQIAAGSNSTATTTLTLPAGISGTYYIVACNNGSSPASCRGSAAIGIGEAWITSLSPTTGAPGTSVTITGTNYGVTQGSSTVSFNGVSVIPTSWSTSQIVLPVPSGATTGNVVVTVSGLASNAVNFTILVPPSVSTISPMSGPVAAAVTITGANFGPTQGTSTVSFNGLAATPTSWNNSQIVVPVPSVATTGNVVVMVNGLASGGVSYTVLLPPSLSAFSPTSGSVGTAVTITGKNFGATQGTSTVSFNGVAATPTSWSDTQIVVSVPSGAVSGDISIQVAGLIAQNAPFSVQSSVLQLRIDDTPASVNLSDPVNIDWIVWGADGSTPAATRSAGTPLISDFTPINTTNVQGNVWGYILYSWSNGTPIASGSGAAAEAQAFDPNSGFQITVPADTTVKTLKIYAGVNGNAALSASISDGSSPAISDSSVTAGGEDDKTYSIDFQAASSGQTLTVTFTLTSASGYVALQAAALTPHLPQVAITSPTAGQSFTAGGDVPLNVSATQFNANIGSVSITGDSTQLFSWTNTPYSATWSSVAGGHHQLSAQATDSTGLVGISAPVEFDAIGAGGNLNVALGQVAPSTTVDLTAEGTADWRLFTSGVCSNCGVTDPWKSDVSSLISAYQTLGDHPSYTSWSYGTEQFSFTDGAPDTQEIDVSPYVSVDGVGNGFQLTVAADTTPRTLRLYASAEYAVAQLQAFLSDGSAPVVVDQSLNNPNWYQQNVYTINYNAASANQSLTIRLTLASEYDWGELQIYAATLTGPSKLAVPQVSSISPSSGVAGDRVIIAGSGFGASQGDGTVLFNGTPAGTTFWSPGSIGAIVPAGVSSGPATVVTDGGASNSNVTFTVAPSVITMDPSLGPVGTNVTLSGSGFGASQGTNIISFNGTPAIPSYWSDTQIVVQVPAGATTGSVQLQMLQGTVLSNAPNFTVTWAAAGGTGSSAPVHQLRTDTPSVWVNLTDPVNLDWIVWGADGFTTTATRKSGANLISDFSPINTTQVSGDLNGFILYNWSGGAPIAIGNGLAAEITSSTQNGGFQITVPADTNVKTLKLYAGYIYGAQLIASISDGSSPAISISPYTLYPVSSVEQVYSIDFRAASAGQTLTVQLLSAYSFCPISLQAAVLQPHLPEVQVLSPQDQQAFSSPVNLTVGAAAAQYDSLISGVQITGAGNSLSPLQASPYTWPWSPTPGHYVLQGKATDSTGLTGTAPDVELDVIGSGGTLSGSGVAYNPTTATDLTGEGTVDWIVFPLRQNWSDLPNDDDYSGIVRKAGIPQMISGFRPVDRVASTICGSALSFSFEDGLPDPQEASVDCSVASASVPESGFEFTVKADTTPRTLLVYLGVTTGQGRLVAFMSDGSAPVIDDRSLQVPGCGDGVSNCGYGSFVYTINFSTATAGQTLTVRWLMDEPFTTSGALELYAAALSGPPVQAPMEISNVDPASGAVGDLVSITGTGFGAAPGTVTIGATPMNIVNWNDGAIVATIGAGTSTGVLRVQEGSNVAKGPVFTVYTVGGGSIAPYQVSPTYLNMAVGASQTVSVTDNGQPVARLGWTSTNPGVVTLSSDDPPLITAVTPGAATIYAGLVPIPVTVYPGITNLSPTAGPAGTQVTITGSGFGSTQGTSTVVFAGAVATPTSWNNMQIVVPAPLGASTGSVIVTVNGVASNVALFAVPLVINNVTPTAGPVGTAVTLTGSGFGVAQKSSTVTFNGTVVSPSSWNNTQIVVPVPLGATNEVITITIGGVVSSGIPFTVTPARLDSISPNVGGAGNVVLLNGLGFLSSQPSSTVTFNGVSASILSWSNSAIAAIAPTGVTTGPVQVTVGGVSTDSLTFTVTGTNIPPAISSLNPYYGTIGTLVTIIGSGFGATQGSGTVLFNGIVSPPTYWSDTEIVVPVPNNATTGPVVVNANGLTGLSQTFAVVPLPSTSTVEVLTNSRGAQTTFTASNGAVIAVSGPGCSSCMGNEAVSREIDGNGRVSATSNALGYQTSYQYDSFGNATAITVQVNSSTSATTQYSYNSNSQVLTSTDPLGNVTTNAYDANGNLTSVASPSPDGSTAPSVTQFTYDSNGHLLTITDPLRRVTTMTYNSVGLVQSITDAQQNVTSYQYDARGNRTFVTDPMKNVTSFTYDLENRLTSITYPDGTSSGFGYDYRGRRTSATDQNGKTATYAYDDADRLTSVTDAGGNTTQYAYDTESNLVSVTDANGYITSFTYDANNRVDQTSFPSGLAENYAHDAVGNLMSKTDRNGQTITYAYDGLQRLLQKQYPDSTSVEYVYDLVGRVQQVNDPSGSYGFAYDNMGRLIGTTTSYAFLAGQTFNNSYSYDAASNRASFNAPDGSTDQYTYDTLNRLSNLSNSWAGNFGFSYDALSRRTQLTRPNNISTTYQYDTLSRLLSILHNGANDGANYSYDAAGNRTSKQNQLTGITENYSYDTIYELTQVIQAATAKTTESYSYDPVGNRLSSLLGQYSLNNSNELTALAANSYTYDANGNMLSKTSGTNVTGYTWDFENRLSSIALPNNGGTVSFRYDPLGRRIQKTSASGVTNYLYDGANIAAEVSASGGVVASYTQGAGVDEPLAMQRGGYIGYYHADGLGSITSLKDINAKTIATYVYDSFGNTTPTEGIFNSYRYTGREQDPETGLYYYRARYYDPSIGRFISEDPIGFDGGADFYAYVGNRPTSRIDPLGLCPLSEYAKGALKVVGGAAAVFVVATNPEVGVFGALAGGISGSASFVSGSTQIIGQATNTNTTTATETVDAYGSPQGLVVGAATGGNPSLAQVATASGDVASLVQKPASAAGVVAEISTIVGLVTGGVQSTYNTIQNLISPPAPPMPPTPGSSNWKQK